MNSKVRYAVAAVLSGVCAGAVAAPPSADAQSPGPTPSANTNSAAGSNPAAVTGGLQEITVTAQRRTENIQNVPISMQALTGQTLEQMNVQTFDDYIKYLPNVTVANNGPGQNEVFMRGLSAGSQASQGSGSTGLWPNVAIYLDNQSAQLPNRNLDIYAADLNRIEVLAGPQGTLFGAGAEAGVIRYITNEPKLNVFEGNAKAGYGVTAHGDPNTDATLVLNVPLITDHLAARAVFFGDRRGGYIDNVPATFTRRNTDVGIHYADYQANALGQCPGPNGVPNNGFCVPPGSPVINNQALVGKAINPTTYSGGRAELLYQINDDWSLLLSQMYQNLNTQGVFYQQPNASDGQPLQPLQVTLFNPAFDKDRFSNTAWTLSGKLGPLKAVYTGGYLVRNVEQTSDYTNYARGKYADYYQCYGPPGPGTYVNDPALKSTCFSPSSFWRSQERNTHLQNELRFSTPDDWRLRGIVGVYQEDNTLYDVTSWLYKTIPACTTNAMPGTVGNGNTGCLTNVGTFPGTTVQYPGVQSDNTSFYQDQVRETKQLAFFVSADFDIIPKVLTLTAGTRHFRFENSMAGSVMSSFGCFEGGAPPGGCQSGFSYNLNADHLSDTESGFKSRANITWHVIPDVMLYYTFSQGFRPGGFNQNGNSAHAIGADGNPQYIVPTSYLSDKLTNNEVGWKTEWFGNRLQWNGAIYRENWDNVQIEFFDPGVVGNIFYDTNGQNFLIKGIETSINAQVLEGLTLQAAGAWNQSKQTNSPALIDNNNGQIPGVTASSNYGKPITQVCPGGACTPITNPFGQVGSPSADAPPLQFSVRLRYDWSIGDFRPYVQVGATHNGHSFTQAGSNPTIAQAGLTTSRLRFELPAYSTYDASIGVAKDAWYVTVYGQNLSNSNAATFISTDQFIVAQTPLRPRVIGATFGYNF